MRQPLTRVLTPRMGLGAVLFWMWTISFGVASCGGKPLTGDEGPSLCRDVSQLYCVILPVSLPPSTGSTHVGGDVLAGAPIVIVRGSTIAGYAAPEEGFGGRFFDRESLALKGLSEDTFLDFKDANHTEKTLSGMGCSGMSVLVLPVSEYDGLFLGSLSPEANWAAFRRRFGSSAARVAVSAVGWSKSGTQALVYMEVFRGPDDAHGVYLSLSRASGEWVIEDQLVAWLA